MNPDNFTHKTNEALVAAHEMASEAGHAQLTPLHLAAALAADKGGILRQAITGASGGDGSAGDSFERVLASALKKLPSQSPPPDSVPASTALIKAIRRAQSAQKKRGDSHLAVDQLLLGLLEDSQISDCLKEAGVSAARVRAELEKLRGGEGRRVESASGDTNFQALKTYGRDLVEQAGKLDPVIGRDEEIRRVVRILSRRTKNNPVLIGEAGVGKTAVVDIRRRDGRRRNPSGLAPSLEIRRAKRTRILREYPLPEPLRFLCPSSKQTKSGSAPTGFASHLQPNTRTRSEWLNCYFEDRVLFQCAL